jgi:group I intron endonuclease
MNGHGIENFTFEEIDGANNQDELNYREWLWIKKLDCIYPNGYNLREGGGSKGKMHPDSLIKNSYNTKTRFEKVGEKEKQSQKIKNYFKNKENRDRVSNQIKEKWSDPEYREMMTLASKLKNIKNPNLQKSILKSRGLRYFIVFDKKGNKLGEWINKTEASIVLKINRNRISYCLRNNKDSRKYKFIYKE